MNKILLDIGDIWALLKFGTINTTKCTIILNSAHKDYSNRKDSLLDIMELLKE